MKERPILFSGPMVRAILEGRKTQTRRVLKGSTEFKGPYNPAYLEAHKNSPGWGSICPYGQPGDRLWLRETWAQPTTLDPGPTFYRADYPSSAAGYENLPPASKIRWKPSIHMFRHQSRITLEVTEVRVQRLREISVNDAFAEGCGISTDKDNLNDFQNLWDSINGKRPGYDWQSNPWVWAVSFKRIKP